MNGQWIKKGKVRKKKLAGLVIGQSFPTQVSGLKKEHKQRTINTDGNMGNVPGW